MDPMIGILDTPRINALLAPSTALPPASPNLPARRRPVASGRVNLAAPRTGLPPTLFLNLLLAASLPNLLAYLWRAAFDAFLVRPLCRLRFCRCLLLCSCLLLLLSSRLWFLRLPPPLLLPLSLIHI